MDSVPFGQGGKSERAIGTAKTTKSRHNLRRQSDRENKHISINRVLKKEYPFHGMAYVKARSIVFYLTRDI